MIVDPIRWPSDVFANLSVSRDKKKGWERQHEFSNTSLLYQHPCFCNVTGSLKDIIAEFAVYVNPERSAY